MKKRFIPIGISCSPTHFLRSKSLRKDAYPFDWTVTPLRSVVELIENGFEGFLEYKNLEFLPPTNRMLFEENGIDLKISNEIITPVICRRYGILYPHDFSSKGKDDYVQVKRKYDRRIERFKDHTLDVKSVRFVYDIGALNDWQASQYELLGLKFDNIDARQFIGIAGALMSNGYEFVSLPKLNRGIPVFPRKLGLFAKKALNKMREQVLGSNG